MSLAHGLVEAGGRDGTADCRAAAHCCQLGLPVLWLYVFISFRNLMRGEKLKRSEKKWPANHEPAWL